MSKGEQVVRLFSCAQGSNVPAFLKSCFMFDFVRKHTRIMQFLLFLLIFPSFVLFGVEGYSRMREKGDAVAKIDGAEILQGDWDFAHKQEIDRIRAQAPNIDVKLLDTPEAKYRTLERLVRDKVLAAAAENARLTVNDAQLSRALASEPAIAALRRTDGTLDIARYQQLLAAQGMSPEMFEAKVRGDLSARQVVSGIVDTGFSAGSVADKSLAAYFERRAVQAVLFRPADFLSKISPTAADLEAFHKAHSALFQALEEATVEYVVLDIAAVMKTVTVNDSDLKTYYDQNATTTAGQEQRRASHILINASKDATAVDKQKAKAKAEELQLAAKKSPSSFADLAKKNSQDTGSAVNGGDLDFFGRGAMVKAFEDAAFALKVGEISDVVESEFGYHIIKLTDINSPKVKSFEEAKPELEATVKKQLALKKYAEAADVFTNTVYEQSDSLKPVAEKLKLEIKTVNGLTRMAKPGEKGVVANPKFLNAVFSSDSVEKKHNTEAVELGGNQMVSARITKYSPAHTQAFDEVKDKVRDQFIAKRGAELAKAEGIAKLAGWKANPASATYPGAVTVSRDDPQKLPAQVVDAALRADPAAMPVEVGVDLGPVGYAVLKVIKSVPRDPPAVDAAKQERQQYTRQWTAAENLAYYEVLKERFKVRILAPKPSATAADKSS
jgi:peptidyl-prolyl cis-trans isomerase D